MAAQRDAIVSTLLDRYGRTYAEDAGIRLAGKPSPLYRLLVLATLLSARISADIAIQAARELFAAGYTTPPAMQQASWQDRVDALGRSHYRRYDERTAGLVREIEAFGTTLTPAELDGSDIVHWDLHPGNVLVDGGAVSAVIDTDFCAVGDAAFDLVTADVPGTEREVSVSYAGLPNDVSVGKRLYLADGAIALFDALARNMPQFSARIEDARRRLAHLSDADADGAEHGVGSAGGAVYIETAGDNSIDDVLDLLIGGVFVHDNDHG